MMVVIAVVCCVFFSGALLFEAKAKGGKMCSEATAYMIKIHVLKSSVGGIVDVCVECVGGGGGGMFPLFSLELKYGDSHGEVKSCTRASERTPGI